MPNSGFPFVPCSMAFATVVNAVATRPLRQCVGAFLWAIVCLGWGASSTAVNLLNNPGAESDLSIGWTEISGDWQQRSANPASHEGAAYFMTGVSASGELRQDVSVANLSAEIDQGATSFTFTGWVGAFTGSDTARVVVEYLDGTATLLSSYDSQEQTSFKSWIRITDTRVAPPGTEIIRIRLIAVRNSGNNDGYFDGLVVEQKPSIPRLLIAGFVSEPLYASPDEVSSQAGQAFLVVNTTDSTAALDAYEITDAHRRFRRSVSLPREHVRAGLGLHCRF